MRRGQNDQRECEQQPEGQEGPAAQSHGAAPLFGEGKKAAHSHSVVVLSGLPLCDRLSAVLLRRRNGSMMEYTCWRLSQ